MNDILKAIETAFGSRVLASALIIAALYFVLSGVLRLWSRLRSRFLDQERTAIVKTHLEALNIAYEIEALRKKENLEKMPVEATVLDALTNSASALTALDPVSRIRDDQERKWAEFFKNHRITGYTVLYTSRILAQIYGTGFLFFFLMFAIFGGRPDYERVHWDNAFLLTFLVLAALYSSGVACKAIRRAGLKDPIGYWSYAAGIAITAVLYLMGWRG